MKNKNKNKNNIITFPSNVSKIERQVEAILFSASEPLDIETIEERVKSSSDITKILEKIQNSYKKHFQLQKYSNWIVQTLYYDLQSLDVLPRCYL